MTPRLVLSTCGTSLLTNAADDSATRGLVIRHANAAAPDDISQDERESLSELIHKARARLEQADNEQLGALTAELNGILRWYGGALGQSADHHWLITTDTWLGTETGQSIAGVLERAGFVTEVKRIQDLRTSDLAEFRSAMAELARLCAQEVRGYRSSGWRVIFNLTGGFKSVQGFMQALGMLYADESVYVFERTDELLRLPRLPLTLDAPSLVRAHARIFRRLAVGLPVSTQEAAEVPDTLLMEEGGKVALSVWGDVVWAEAGRAILEERLWEPVDEKLRFASAFEKSASKCDRDRLRLINERLAQLARRLNDPAYNPRSLDFKELKGSHGPWTHECDAWSDRDAKRLFGHFEQGVYVIDALEKGFH